MMENVTRGSQFVTPDDSINAIWAIPGTESAIVEEANRIAEELLSKAGNQNRPEVISIGFEGITDVDELAYSDSDEHLLLKRQRDPSDFPRGAEGLRTRALALERLINIRGSPGLILFPHDPNSAVIAAELSQLTQGGCVTDGMVRVTDGGIVFGKSVYEDRALAAYNFINEPKICTLDTSVIESTEGADHRADVETITISVDQTSRTESSDPGTEKTFSGGSIRRISEFDVPEEDLSRARRIVAAGAGVDGPEGVSLLAELADTLGAAMGASRPPVDEGWLPFDRQIGDTGKEVDAELYIPCGISGDPYHTRGVQADYEIAINTDPEAEIFSRADVGIVGDLHEYVPAIIEAIETYEESSNESTQTNDSNDPDSPDELSQAEGGKLE